jgi:hypothetical protein
MTTTASTRPAVRTCSYCGAKKRRWKNTPSNQRLRAKRVRLPPRERVEPVLGPLARAAAKTPVGGSKRRKLLVLLAAYADAGESSPGAATLATRLKVPMRVFDGLLAALERDGWSKSSAGRESAIATRCGHERRSRLLRRARG